MAAGQVRHGGRLVEELESDVAFNLGGNGEESVMIFMRRA